MSEKLPEKMTPAEFAEWKLRVEANILRIREEADEIRRAADEFRRQADELAVQREKDAARREAAADRRMKRIEQDFGGWTNNANERLENEFAEALEENMQIGGIRLDAVLRRLKSKYEYDLAGTNCDAVVVGEIKRKLLPEDVRRFAAERLPHFAADCPLVAGARKVFGMVAGEVIVPDAEAAAKECGLFVLRLKNKKLIVANAEGARAVN